MIKDYYDILGIKCDASPDYINQQYKRLVLRWHPRFAKEDHTTAHYHFSQISEAYEVLNDPLKRAFYDQYGYLKLKEGLYSQGELKGGYRFADNPDQIFEKFFQANSPLAQSIDRAMIEKGSLFGGAFGGLNFSQDFIYENLIVEVPCSLNELYIGVAKKVTYKRRVLNLDGRTTQWREEQKLLQIRPGYGVDTNICYAGEGHDYVNRVTSDLVFKIIELPHPNYKRKGKDLIYTHYMPLADALDGQAVTLMTLDNRIIRVPIDRIICPNVLQEVEGEGMPGTPKGNLYLRFQIMFPPQLSAQTKNELRSLLHD